MVRRTAARKGKLAKKTTVSDESEVPPSSQNASLELASKSSVAEQPSASSNPTEREDSSSKKDESELTPVGKEKDSVDKDQSASTDEVPTESQTIQQSSSGEVEPSSPTDKGVSQSSPAEVLPSIPTERAVSPPTVEEESGIVQDSSQSSKAVFDVDEVPTQQESEVVQGTLSPTSTAKNQSVKKKILSKAVLEEKMAGNEETTTEKLTSVITQDDSESPKAQKQVVDDLPTENEETQASITVEETVPPSEKATAPENSDVEILEGTDKVADESQEYAEIDLTIESSTQLEKEIQVSYAKNDQGEDREIMDESSMLLEDEIHENPELLDNYEFSVIQSGNIPEKQHFWGGDETPLFEILKKAAAKKNLPPSYQPVFLSEESTENVSEKQESSIADSSESEETKVVEDDDTRKYQNPDLFPQGIFASENPLLMLHPQDPPVRSCNMRNPEFVPQDVATSTRPWFVASKDIRPPLQEFDHSPLIKDLFQAKILHYREAKNKKTQKSKKNTKKSKARDKAHNDNDELNVLNQYKDHEIVYNNGSVVRKDDLLSLLPGQWITGTIIGAALNYLWETYVPDDLPLSQQMHVFDPSFLVLLLQGKPALKRYRPSRVKKIMMKRFQGKAAIQSRALLFICHTKQVHWQLIIVYPRLKEIEIMDPAGWDGQQNARLIFRLLYDDAHEYLDDDHFHDYFQPSMLDYGWKYIDTLPAIPKQTNSFDCGYFVIGYAEAILRGFDPRNIVQKDALKTRRFYMAQFSEERFFKGKKGIKRDFKPYWVDNAISKSLKNKPVKEVLPIDEDPDVEQMKTWEIEVYDPIERLESVGGKDDLIPESDIEKMVEFANENAAFEDSDLDLEETPKKRPREKSLLALPSFRREHPQELERRKQELFNAKQESKEKKRKKPPPTEEEKAEAKRKRQEREKEKREENKKRYLERQEKIKLNRHRRQVIEIAKNKLLKSGIDKITTRNRSAWLKHASIGMQKVFMASKDHAKHIREQLDADPESIEAQIQQLRFVKGRSGLNSDGEANFPVTWKDRHGSENESWYYNYYEGKDKEGKTITQLNPEWVEAQFNEVFLEMCKMTPLFLPIPIGSSYFDGVPVPSHLELRHLQNAYRQKNNEYCLTYSVASALRYMKFGNEAILIAQEADFYSSLPGDNALDYISQLIQVHVPMIGRFVVYNKVRPKKPIRIMTKEDLLRDLKPYLTLVLPVARDGSSDHVFCVVDDVIFDARCKYPLKLTNESLDWICGKNGCEKLGPVYYFGESMFPKKLQKKEYLRHLRRNW